MAKTGTHFWGGFFQSTLTRQTMRTVFSLLVMLSLSIGAMAQNTVQVSGSTGTTTWTSGNTYILNGYVFVSAGQSLTIEPGTVVKGAAGSGSDASALIVAKGGQIFANGTAAAPIVHRA